MVNPMIILYYLLSFLVSTCSKQAVQLENNNEVVFYDLNAQLRRPFLGRLPCQCSSWTCGCCAGMSIAAFNFDRRACLNFTYDPYEFAIITEMLMNDESIYEQKFSAKNPPPACVPMAIPLLSAIDFCVQFYDIYTPGRNLHICLDFLARISRAPVVVLHFNCLQIGRDGIFYLHPGEVVAITSSSTIPSAVTETGISQETTEPGADEFDPVTEIQKNITQKVDNLECGMDIGNHLLLSWKHSLQFNLQTVNYLLPPSPRPFHLFIYLFLFVVYLIPLIFDCVIRNDLNLMSFMRVLLIITSD